MPAQCQESAGRAKYNEMEIHRTNATAKAHRLVHQWRSVIGWPGRRSWPGTSSGVPYPPIPPAPDRPRFFLGAGRNGFVFPTACKVADSLLRNMDELKVDGQRMKFPAKSGCHQGRWCSGSLKAQVESKLYSDIDGLAQDVKILVISGERRQERCVHLPQPPQTAPETALECQPNGMAG